MKKYKDVYLPEVLFEFHKIRKSKIVRVVALDPITRIEVTMIGAPGYSQEDLKRLAARKLAYVIDKRQKMDRDRK